jgi:hypothetical protein
MAELLRLSLLKMPVPTYAQSHLSIGRAPRGVHVRLARPTSGGEQEGT